MIVLFAFLINSPLGEIVINWNIQKKTLDIIMENMSNSSEKETLPAPSPSEVSSTTAAPLITEPLATDPVRRKQKEENSDCNDCCHNCGWDRDCCCDTAFDIFCCLILDCLKNWLPSEIYESLTIISHEYRIASRNLYWYLVSRI